MHSHMQRTHTHRCAYTHKQARTNTSPHTYRHTHTHTDTHLQALKHTYRKQMFTYSLYSLSNCSITEEGFSSLASALRSNPSHMRELWLEGNKAGDSGVKHLSSLLEDPNCKLEKLE